MPANHYIRWFKELSLDDLALVGGKNASLGEMFQQLTPLGVRIPDGFAVTASAYCDALDAANAWPELHRLLDTLDKRDTDALARAGARAREIVYGAAMPAAVEQQLRQAWRELKAATGESLSVAVRSSATAEDLPNASFAGQHDTYLNVQGEEMLIDAVKRCQASLFTDRAISYRIDNGFDHFKVFLSVAVMQMVRSDRASAGVMFTINTESGHPDVVFITGAWGLGENVVQGAVDPDEFYVHKPTFVNGFRSVLRKTLGDKQVHMVYAPGRTREPVINKPTPRADRKRYCLSDADVLVLADAAIKIEDHYSQRAGQRRAMDIEWAKDGPDGELFIVQARPETAISQRNASKLEEYVLDGTGNVRAQGRAVGAKIATGKARVVTDGQHLS
ncbi:MAG TPA: PEP/pyruvate-binding domain-containing protein, partial [Burkholderiaceae bacterium]|nr:PEP/pyruvate-binding domain-containing protein [Burkholderiaceae bacterium]